MVRKSGKERFQIALRHGDPEKPAPHVDTGHGIITFGLGQQPFRLCDFDDVGQTRLIARPRLGFRLACGGQLHRRIPGDLCRRVVGSLRGRNLTRQVLQCLLVPRLLAALLRLRHALLIAQARNVKQIGEHYGNTRRPVGARKAQPLHTPGKCTVGIYATAARKGFRLQEKTRVVGVVSTRSLARTSSTLAC